MGDTASYGGCVSNRLTNATSPYLQQHAANPVHWFEWGPEAFAEAQDRQVPILLSVGYAACHWCHVMAHESFEDPETAELMNRGFVNIKVDREERPDVDAVYMDAVQGLTGHGGWPMTVFCTPEGDAFYAGTYYPPQPRHGMPSFSQVLSTVAQTWAQRRDEVESAAERIGAELRRRAEITVAGQPPAADDLAAAVASLGAQFDEERGGFGGAPKFPPSMLAEFLLRHHARTGDADALRMVSDSLTAMARGGIYDQLAGGFARYSVDAGWVVPHFEKMLYDNSLLLRVYAHWWRLTGSPLAERVARQTADFLITDLRTPEGGFAASLDADTDGVEGATYVWTPRELTAVLGADDGRWVARQFEVTDAGTFEDGRSVLQLRADPDDSDRYERVCQALLEARRLRPQPTRDDKVVTAWNGWAIAALAEAGVLFDAPEYAAAATRAAELIWRVHRKAPGRLVRASRDGTAGAPGAVLEDYAALGDGLLTLFGVDGDVRWWHAAKELADAVLDRFGDEAGGFYDTAHDSEALSRRPRDPADSATPSGWFAAAGLLLGVGAMSGQARYRDAAMAALGAAGVLARQAPRAAGWGLAVAEALVDGPREVAIVGPADARGTLVRTAWLGTAPGLLVAPGESNQETPPLLRGRDARGGPTAYVCRGFVCQAPVTEVSDLTLLVSM